MGEQVKEILNWARQRKILASAFVALTLLVGILIGSLVSGRVSATKGFGFAGTNATALTVPDPIPATNTFAGIVNKVEPAVVNIATAGSTLFTIPDGPPSGPQPRIRRDCG